MVLIDSVGVPNLNYFNYFKTEQVQDTCLCEK